MLLWVYSHHGECRRDVPGLFVITWLFIAEHTLLHVQQQYSWGKMVHLLCALNLVYQHGQPKNRLLYAISLRTLDERLVVRSLLLL